MCGRLTQTAPIEELVRYFLVHELRLNPVEPRYNVAPSQAIAAILQEHEHRVLTTLRWGLVPFWAPDIKVGYKMINARAEGIATKPSFKNALTRRRCLIPTNGFYEWRKEPDGTKTPMFIHPRHGLFAFAGLWESWRPKDEPDAAPLLSCTIITCGANALMESIHDRMPVILDDAAQAAWLDPAHNDANQLVELLEPCDPANMDAYPISTLVNSPKNEGPALLNPVVLNPTLP